MMLLCCGLLIGLHAGTGLVHNCQVVMSNVLCAGAVTAKEASLARESSSLCCSISYSVAVLLHTAPVRPSVSHHIVSAWRLHK